MRRTLFIVLLCVLFLPACSDVVQETSRSIESYFPEEHQVKNHIDGKVSSFGLNIAPAANMGEWVADWAANVSEGEGFQYFVYSDPDSWDVYLRYPNNRAKMPLLTNDNVKVDFSGGALKVYVTENIEKIVSADDTQDWVLHFAAYPFGAWPDSVELYWNDIAISCDATKFDA